MRTRARLVLALLPVVAALACAPAQGPSRTGDARYFGALRPLPGQVLRFTLGTEPELRDPGTMSGQPDGRFGRLVFEGLVVNHPQTLEPVPGQARAWEVSPDGRTYTFHLRPGLQWWDGTPLTAHDFVYSWRRVLSPATASRNASLLYLLRNGEAFNKGEITDSTQVGVVALDDTTLVATLENPTPYFLFLCTFYTYMPVPRHVVERHGIAWTRRENLVGNGPFLWTFWRRSDRYEFVPNPRFWNADSVRLEKVIAFTVDDLSTCTNLYKSGVLDWLPSGYIPSQYLPFVRDFADFRHGRYQGTYFYSVNTTRKPFDDPRVRRALGFAINREAIARDLLKGSRDPWGGVTPSGYPGYDNPPGMRFDPERARAELAAAGYPEGRGFPEVEVLFNTSEDHRRIAEVIQAQWREVLGIRVRLLTQEWGTYLQTTTALGYDVARRAWIGDYLDPATFLKILVGGDGNNRTGWADPEYDRLVREATRTADPAERLAILRRAEERALEAAVFLPIYHYSTNEMVKPYVRGIYQTALDTHPLTYVWIDHDWREHEPVAGPASPRP